MTTLTALDRCDRCGARAYHRVTFTASDLLFCTHCYRANQDCLPQPTTAAMSGQPGE